MLAVFDQRDDDILAFCSGARYERAAARELIMHADCLTAREVVDEGLRIAADICIYTIDRLTILELDAE